VDDESMSQDAFDDEELLGPEETAHWFDPGAGLSDSEAQALWEAVVNEEIRVQER
jgi:hypothetical protein